MLKTLTFALTALLSAACSHIHQSQAAPVNDHGQTLQVHMAGDSTMAIKHPKDYPETGWGVPFATFFADSVEVINYAQNGRSTRTFIADGLWRKLISAVKPNDYVIMQFGHNDEVEHKKDRYTTPGQYQANLQRFIDEVNAKSAYPILLTPIIRRYFNDRGELTQTHPYSDLVRQVADRNPDVYFMDMEIITEEYFNNLGDKNSAIRFMHIRPDTHPNYPNGIRDNTHLNQLGAREVAQLVLKQLRDDRHQLADKTRSVDPKHLNYSYSKQ